MNRSEATTRMATRVVLAGFFLAALSCSSSADHSDSSRAVVAGASDSMRESAQDSVRNAAMTSDTTRTVATRDARMFYEFGPERPPVSVRDTAFKGPYVADDAVPRMWIATARLKANAARPASRIIARIRSERAYPALGLAAGYNYVVRNSWDTAAASRWMTRIVADDPAMKPHELVRDSRRLEYTHGKSPLEPRLVRIKVHSTAIGMCLDDPICPTGHCGYY